MSWHIDIATDIGGRATQQDRAAVFDVPGHADARLVVLADGMGGLADGDLAAQAVIDTAAQALADTAIDHPQRFLDALCQRADRAVIKLGREHASTPGSTCVLLYLCADEAYWAHVGDSRLYHYAGRELLSHTRDHTVGELVKDAAGGSAADAASPELLYMCLGGQNALQPEIGASATGGGDWFLLCSDGFWNQVDAGEAAELRCRAHADAGPAAQLVALASRRGGARGDNVTVVVATRRETALARAWRRVRRPLR
ncbi:MAG: protein phosphatase 2C domain-containing protein [Gammaproteobacteria bacterium]|nr:protein phosphatase 2C domain-containing protein [Gammaproteobacteria bacterium]